MDGVGVVLGATSALKSRRNARLTARGWLAAYQADAGGGARRRLRPGGRHLATANGNGTVYVLRTEAAEGE